MKLKIFSLMLSVILLLSIFSSCDPKESNNSSTPSSSAVASKTSSVSNNDDLSETLLSSAQAFANYLKETDIVALETYTGCPIGTYADWTNTKVSNVTVTVVKNEASQSEFLLVVDVTVVGEAPVTVGKNNFTLVVSSKDEALTYTFTAKK